MNPLLQPFHTPHSAFPFPEIKVADIREAILEGIKREKEEVNQICQNPEPPTFDNTIVALDHCGSLLDRATTLMYNLSSCATTDELDELANEMAPIISEHSNSIMFNAELFKRVKTAKEMPGRELTEEDRMLLDKTYEGFERSGANLNETDKQAFSKVTKRLSELVLKFSQNVLKDTNAFFLNLTKEEDVAGLPAINRQAASDEAKERGQEGWTITLKTPSFRPFLTYADNRELRRQIYMAYNTIGTHDNDYNNFSIVSEIVNLRRELAQLLGYKSYADYALRRRMAQTPEKVENLLNDLISHYRRPAQKEVERVARFAQEKEGLDFKMEPWDFSYYAQKLNKQLNDYDPNELRPYFELSKVKQGVLGLATRLYGITFQRNEEIPVFNPDVEAYEVFDADGSFLAILYLDFFPRSDKQGGAWMTSYLDEECEEGTSVEATAKNTVRPHVSVTTNFTKPTSDTPALLTLGEVETFLHEFGHALHGIFAMTHYASLSGTSVYWDFVELPSQFMENYAIEPDFLSTFASHYQTGEPLPEEYIGKIRKARHFNAAYACMRQVSFGLLDMAYYSLETPFHSDIRSFEKEAWKEAQLLPDVEGTCMTTQFGHIMSGGYAAGYYSYKWAEVLDADAFAKFKEDGIFNPLTAQSFRSNILSKGGTELPEKLYARFRGQEPSIQALLSRDGIEETAKEA